MNLETILEPLGVVLNTLKGFVPNLLTGLAILLVGWIVARVVRYLVERILELVRLDTLLEKAGIKLQGLQAQVIAALSYWIVIVLALVSAVNAVKLTVATELLDSTLSYLPSVITAVFVLALGVFFGGLARGFVRTALGGTKTIDPELAGKVAQLTIILSAAAASLGQLGVAAALITHAFTVAFAAVAFALALAFGLGGKDLVKGWVEGLLRK